MFPLFFLAVLLPFAVFSASVSVCKELTSCQTCSESWIHLLGFRQECRWCVETSSCTGPFGCPLGKPVVLRDPFRCPMKYSLEKGKRYTDALGRSVFAVSASLGADNSSECLHSVRPDIGFIRTYKVECDSAGNTCSALIAVSEEAKALYIAYKGSAFDKQLLTEFFHGLAAQLGAWEKFESTEVGVITYFHGAFYKLFVEGGMKDDLLDLKKKYPNYRLWITGHSLGGSLASLTSLYLIKKGLYDPEKIRLVTFGEPRTGNTLYAKEMERLVPFRYRIVKKNDPVPNMPNSVDPNTPFLTASQHERQPLHYRHMVHYDNNMVFGNQFKICELSDDHGCRNLAMAGDFNDHVSYFVNHGDFIKNGCPRATLISEEIS